jgi:hypothetical protein
MHADRRRLVLAAAGALCAAGLAAGCGAQGGNVAPGVNNSATESSAPNAAGQWTDGQKATAQTLLEGPPISEGTGQAACVVKLAAATISWQQFQDYLKLLEDGPMTAPPNGTSTLANAASKCGTQNAAPELGGSSSS